MSKNIKEAAEKMPVASKKESMENTKMVYCGPTIKNVAKQYTVFINGIPSDLNKEIENYPYLSNLIVPIDKFSETRKAVEREGTAENIIFNKFLKEGNYGL